MAEVGSVIDGRLAQKVVLVDPQGNFLTVVGGGTPISGTYLSATPTLTNGQTAVLLLDQNGNLRVNPGALVSTSDSVLAIPQRPTTATSSRPTAATSSGTQKLLDANSGRWGVSLYNEGPSAGYVKLGATATVTSYWCIVPALGYAEVPFQFVGQIDAITASGTAQFEVVEFTA